MSVEMAWKQNNLVTDFHLLKILQVVFGLGLQTFVSNFSRQNICSVFLFLQIHDIGFDCIKLFYISCGSINDVATRRIIGPLRQWGAGNVYL